VCPDGWHLPSKSEFETLLNKYGGKGKQAYTALKSGGSSNFLALFGGHRGSGGTFYSLGEGASFWSSSEGNSGNAWSLGVRSYYRKATMHSYFKIVGRSVRCVED